MSDILLVEDNDVIARTYATALTIDGHEVRFASDGVSLEVELNRAVPDLLLLDIGLPGVDGLDILRRIREDASTAKLRVAVLSNYTDRKIVHEALRMNALEYVEKASLTPSVLVDQVRGWLEQ